MNRSCRKVSFETKKEAAERAQEINQEENKRLIRHYQCEFCDNWHLTSMKKHDFKFKHDKKYRSEVKRKSFLRRESEYWMHRLGVKQ